MDIQHKGGQYTITSPVREFHYRHMKEAVATPVHAPRKVHVSKVEFRECLL
jgi:hypothetical protein